MNNIFNNLTTSLSEEFKKYELNENIQLKCQKLLDMIYKLTI